MDPTPQNPTGPAYRRNAPFRETIGGDGEAMIFEGRVLAGDGRPVGGAVVDVWQASPWGIYDMLTSRMRYRGRQQVGPDGRFHFRTVVPGGYLWRPPHVHVKVWLDEAVVLTTQVYLAGHRRLRVDPWVRHVLVAPVVLGRLHYDLVLASP